MSAWTILGLVIGVGCLVAGAEFVNYGGGLSTETTDGGREKGLCSSGAGAVA